MVPASASVSTVAAAYVYVCKGLDKLEVTLPMLLQPADKVQMSFM